MAPHHRHRGASRTGSGPGEQRLHLERRFQRCPDAQQIPRTGAFHGQPRGQALHVAHAAEDLAQPGEGHLVPVERFHRVESTLERGPVQQRGQQPPAKRPRARGGSCLVEHLEQREATAAVLEVGEQLEVALRGLVEAHEGALAVDGERAEVVEGAPRVLAQVVEQDAGGHGLGRVVGEAEPLQVRHLQLPHQPFARRGGVEAPVGQPVHEQVAALVEQPADRLAVGDEAFGHDHLARIEPVQLAGEVLGARLGGEGRGRQLTGRQVGIGQSHASADAGDGREVVVRPPVEEALVEHGARGDDLDHLPAHQALPGR